MADGFEKSRPVIKLGRKLLLAVGYFSEILGKDEVVNRMHTILELKK